MIIGSKSRLLIALVASLSVLAGPFSSDSRFTLNDPFNGGGQVVAAEPLASEEHPFAVLSLASVERLLARVNSLGEVVGNPEFGQKLLFNDEEFGKILQSPGLDKTRPIGFMSYPNWFNSGSMEEDEAADPKAAKEPKTTAMEDLISDPFEFLQVRIFQKSVFLICFPMKDREVLLATIAELMKDKLNPVADRPGWYEAETDKQVKLRVVGRYLYFIATNGGISTPWDLNYPDFEKLAKGSLGQNDVVYSLHRRGLPEAVREETVNALKMSAAATLQRYDNEPEADFKTRTMFGHLMTEGLDLLLSQIEEFRISGHVDSRTYQTTFDIELVGRNGKLATFANSLVGKSTVFGNISTDDAFFAANIAIPLSQKHWQPVADMFYRSADAIHPFPGFPEMARTIAKTIDAGQLDVHTSFTQGGQGLMAVRIAVSNAFPEQLQLALETLKLQDGGFKPGTIKIAVDSVDGYPVHRVRASTLDDVGFGGFNWSDLTPKDARPTAKAKISRKEAGGKEEDLGETLIQVAPPEDAPQNYLWVVATPTALWVAHSSPDRLAMPDWCKAEIVANLAKSPATAATRRNNSPIQILIRGLGASPPADDAMKRQEEENAILQAAAEKIDQSEENAKPLTEKQKAANEQRAARQEETRRQKQLETERGDVLRDGSNAIRVELQPTGTGLRIRIMLEDAYFHWAATAFQQNLAEDANRAAIEAPAEAAPAEPDK